MTLFTSIVSFLKKKHSLILIPSKEGKTRYFQLSNFALILLSIMLFILITLSISYFIHQRTISQEIKHLQAIYQNHQKEIEAYQQVILNNKSNYQAYSNEIKDVFKLFGTTKQTPPMHLQASDFQVYGENELPAAFETPEEIQAISLLRQDALQALQKLQRLRVLIELQNILIRNIPTGWPIDKSQGYKTSAYGIRNSPFGTNKVFHTGVDIAAKPNTPIVAAADGIVTFAGIKEGYGYTVIIVHQFGYSTLYGHSSKLLIRPRSQVKRGQKIALLGNTGHSTGYHLHFEIRINNNPIDPWPYLNAKM